MIPGQARDLDRELIRELIRMNTIMPGIFQTPLLMGLPEKALASQGAQVPSPSRLGDPIVHASLALEICRNAYLNGESIRLDRTIPMVPK